ncbi:hypothetical protein D9M70_475290 [compost metagenome]
MNPVVVTAALLGQLLTLLGHGGTGFVLQLRRHLRDEIRQLITERRRRCPPAVIGFFQFFQVAVDGGFRAGIAQLDPYGIDTRVFPPRQNGLPRLLHQCLVDATPGHNALLRFRIGLHTTYLHTDYEVKLTKLWSFFLIK